MTLRRAHNSDSFLHSKTNLEKIGLKFATYDLNIKLRNSDKIAKLKEQQIDESKLRVHA